jgi:hypothetical protein
LIVAIHQHDHETPEQQADSESAHLLFFYQCRDIECPVCLHVRSICVDKRAAARLPCSPHAPRGSAAAREPQYKARRATAESKNSDEEIEKSE